MLCTLIGAIILSINIQVGLNMHLYDDIGDASLSLRGSTSSLKSLLYLLIFCSFILSVFFFFSNAAILFFFSLILSHCTGF